MSPIAVNIECEGKQFKAVVVWNEQFGCYVGETASGVKRMGNSIGDVIDNLGAGVFDQLADIMKAVFGQVI